MRPPLELERDTIYLSEQLTIMEQHILNGRSARADTVSRGLLRRYSPRTSGAELDFWINVLRWIVYTREQAERKLAARRQARLEDRERWRQRRG